MDQSRDFRSEFGESLQVNSCVRTVVYQRALAGRNGNAARVSGSRASLHLTGSAVDITKVGMSARQIRWMRERLLRNERQGMVEATEEFVQSVFHVVVFKKYDPPVAKPTKNKPAAKPTAKTRTRS